MSDASDLTRSLLSLVRRELTGVLSPRAVSALDSVALSETDLAALQVVDRELRARSGGPHDTLPNLMASWWQLAIAVDTYPAAIDDYTNDLCGRDLLESALAQVATGDLAAELVAVLAQADAEFKERTVPDVREVLGTFFDTDGRSGWWWRRLPAAGPLLDYLDRSARS